ncbi:MAG TPA: hypothetical protein VGI93_02165 [Steroidobacteraceae bacterium]|jgi:hypothetical protein
MAKALLTFDAVRAAGVALPGVVASTVYGLPALKLNGNLLACVPANKSAEPNSGAFRVDFDLRAALVKQKPKLYYVTDHYANYPMVLVRLSRISPKELRELLGLAWSFTSARKPARNKHQTTQKPAGRNK